MQCSSHAIILKRVAYGDADWIVSFFCRDRGRMSGMAKSARKSKRRFAGAMEPGTIVDMRFVERKSSALVQLLEATVCAPINGALKSLERIEGIARTLNLALAFLQEHESNPAKFDLLRARLLRLNCADPDPFETAIFELTWLARSGFAPVLDRCAGCGTNVHVIEKRWSFDFDRGGLICSSCFIGTTKASFLTEKELIGLSTLTNDSIQSSASSSKAAGVVIGRYIDHVLGRPLKI